MTRIILVRHGETDYNRRQITLGRADVPLNDLGRRQARAVGASFVRPPVAIYSSPLSRCRDTAAAIALATGVPVVGEPALVEMDVGEMEHLPRPELIAKHGDFLRLWVSDEGGEARMPGGETLREVQERAWAAVERIAAAHADADGDIVLVTHNFVIATVVYDAWRAVLRDHERITRELLRAHDGAEVKTLGDGFMASFDSATSAVECAIGLQRAFASRNDTAAEPVRVRVGLNAGEPIAEDDDLFGTAVTMAARIMGQGTGGEILVSDVIRALVAGKGFIFSDRGEFMPKGFDEGVRVWDVRWRE